MSINWQQKTVEISALRPYERNPRKLSKAAYVKLKASIQEMGYHQRCIATPDLRVIGGHQRLKVMQDLGITSVEVLTPDRELSDFEFRRLLIQDNLPFGEFDMEMLSEDFEHEELAEWGMPDALLAGYRAKSNAGLTDPDDEVAPPAVITSLNRDIWLLDSHKLCCGSSTAPDDVSALLGAVKPNLMVTDPPYGVNYDPTWRDNAGGQFGDGKTKMRGKVENDDEAQWTAAYALFPGNVAYVWHGGLHTDKVAANLSEAGFALRAQIIWVKPHFILSRGDYHWMHEPCWYAVRKNANGSWAGDRKQSTVWQIAGMNPAGGSKKAEDKHTTYSTQKPVECMKRPIENNSSPGQAVYEPFSGSGTTIIAGEMTGRSVFAMELNPAYVDMAVLRWQAFTGKEDTHAGTGETFKAVADRRSARISLSSKGEAVA